MVSPLFSDLCNLRGGLKPRLRSLIVLVYYYIGGKQAHKILNVLLPCLTQSYPANCAPVIHLSWTIVLKQLKEQRKLEGIECVIAQPIRDHCCCDRYSAGPALGKKLAVGCGQV